MPDSRSTPLPDPSLGNLSVDNGSVTSSALAEPTQPDASQPDVLRPKVLQPDTLVPDTPPSTTATVGKVSPQRYAASPQFRRGRFHNDRPRPAMAPRDFLSALWHLLLRKPKSTIPDHPLPIVTLTQAEVLAAPDRSLFRLGHSTILLKLHGEFWITDPVFGERASPVNWAGPKRFHAPPLALEDLPPLKGVILSHDHFDHLDRQTVCTLAAKAEVFITPLGVGDRLIGWGVPAQQVHQLDWWQDIGIGKLRLISTPAQHFSGRTPFDSDKTLWTSWVILEAATPDQPGLRLFFSGDSGYFPGFAEIGRRYGPFDLALIENGAYDRRWHFVHMFPEQTLRAYQDLQARRLMPIHNGTFNLGLHPWREPFERLAALAAQHGVPLVTPRIGEAVNITTPAPTTPWWQDSASRP